VKKADEDYLTKKNEELNKSVEELKINKEALEKNKDELKKLKKEIEVLKNQVLINSISEDLTPRMNFISHHGSRYKLLLVLKSIVISHYVESNLQISFLLLSQILTIFQSILGLFYVLLYLILI
jgi:lipid II:glycine glycyltransferase (peptidoglycan interpeptide bridge formation enzyme)